MPTPPVVVKAWQQKRAEPFKSRHQSVAISAFPIINLCQLCLAECVGFSRGDDSRKDGLFMSPSFFLHKNIHLEFLLHYLLSCSNVLR